MPILAGRPIGNGQARPGGYAARHRAPASRARGPAEDYALLYRHGTYGKHHETDKKYAAISERKRQAAARVQPAQGPHG